VARCCFEMINGQTSSTIHNPLQYPFPQNRNSFLPIRKRAHGQYLRRKQLGAERRAVGGRGVHQRGHHEHAQRREDRPPHDEGSLRRHDHAREETAADLVGRGE